MCRVKPIQLLYTVLVNTERDTNAFFIYVYIFAIEQLPNLNCLSAVTHFLSLTFLPDAYRRLISCMTTEKRTKVS
jgi:hypothetical protein